jgi:hypothetical protein
MSSVSRLDCTGISRSVCAVDVGSARPVVDIVSVAEIGLVIEVSFVDVASVVDLVAVVGLDCVRRAWVSST